MEESSRASGVLRAPLVITCAGAALPARGDALGSPGEIRQGALAWDAGALTYVGPAEGVGAPPGAEIIDVGPGVTVVPGFVDAHTHLPFVGWRADEFELRLEGRSYRELHGEGGISRSARMLARASDDEVVEFCRPLLREMLDHGTTALELKTGYGLSVEAELRQARLARLIADEAHQTCTVTLLACHAVPEGIDRPTWVSTACDRLIPAAAEEGLVDAIDIYVEDIAFDLDDLGLVATAADRAQLPLRVHADQLGPSGAAEAAVDLGARSADHLNHVSSDGIRALGSGTTAATLLPASTFVLGEGVPPVRALLDADAPIAVASDLNPGTSPVASIPEAMAMACILYRLTPRQALVAATANAAWVLDVHDRVGTLDVGHRADFVVLDGDDVRQVPYRPGHNPVLDTFVAGARVGGARTERGPAVCP
jgi:imidazolonepropionase